MTKTKNYIHETELENMVSELWTELYDNHEPFAPYNVPYLESTYKELFDLDRENLWIMKQGMDIDLSIWNEAYSEHYLILTLIGRISAYIEEPFDYIETLYKPYTREEISCYEERNGGILW